MTPKSITLSAGACKRWGIRDTDRFVLWGQGQAWASGRCRIACECDMHRVAEEAGVPFETIEANADYMRIRRTA